MPNFAPAALSALVWGAALVSNVDAFAPIKAVNPSSALKMVSRFLAFVFVLSTWKVELHRNWLDSFFVIFVLKVFLKISFEGISV